MKCTALAVIWTASVMIQTATAYPGMAKTFSDIADIQKRQDDGARSTELIGDLLTLSDSQLSPTAKTIKSLITTTNGSAQSADTYNNFLWPKGSMLCQQDTCCIWQYISNDMQKMFRGPSGRCNDYARAAVRLGFHDCAGWSKTTGNLGGCDGSLALSSDEINRSENNGLQTIVGQMKTWYNQYHTYGVSMADLIQMGATVATVTCPLGPRIRSYVGRKDSSVSAPNGLLPGVTQDANSLINLFAAKTISAYGLTALIGAHTTSQQQFVNTARAGDPQDSTPGVWDVLFYNQTLATNVPPRVFKFQSDIVLSQDPRCSKEFNQFAQNDQDDWNDDYSREYLRLSLLGVFNINSLTDCSKVLPARITSYTASDQSMLNKWLSTTTHSSSIANVLFGGNLLSSLGNQLSGILSGLF